MNYRSGDAEGTLKESRQNAANHREPRELLQLLHALCFKPSQLFSLMPTVIVA